MFRFTSTFLAIFLVLNQLNIVALRGIGVSRKDEKDDRKKRQSMCAIIFDVHIRPVWHVSNSIVSIICLQDANVLNWRLLTAVDRNILMQRFPQF